MEETIKLNDQVIIDRAKLERLELELSEVQKGKVITIRHWDYRDEEVIYFYFPEQFKEEIKEVQKICAENKKLKEENQQMQKKISAILVANAVLRKRTLFDFLFKRGEI